MNHIELLKSKEACPEAVEWAKNYPDFKSAWNTCHRGDWMLWIAQKLNVDKRKLTLAKGRCAETVIHLMKDQRSIDAIKAAIAYGNGEIDDTQLKDAADAAYTATAAYAADAAAAAAYAAAYAAAAYAAYAAAACTAAAAAAADAAAARKENRQKTADICREILTEEVLNRLRA